MLSLVVGMGFGNLYKSVLTRMGHEVITVDSDRNKTADFRLLDNVWYQINRFDTAHICVPNWLHEPIARQVAPHCDIIFVEKPGLAIDSRWNKLIEDHPNNRILMVKNNQWRANINAMHQAWVGAKNIHVRWINKNRVPGPGTWFTDIEKSCGGVRCDLIPHLLSLFTKIDSHYSNAEITYKYKMQRWNLSDLTNSDYGNIDVNGVYNVDDYARLELRSTGRNWIFEADWRSNVEDDIAIYFDNTRIELGLCPEEAYANMIQDALYHRHDNIFWENQLRQDNWIQKEISYL